MTHLRLERDFLDLTFSLHNVNLGRANDRTQSTIQRALTFEMNSLINNNNMELLALDIVTYTERLTFA